MYIVKFNGKKLSLKVFAGLKSYEAVRNALRKYLRAKGLDRTHGSLGYSIAKV